MMHPHHQHGGQLQQASIAFNIPLAQWVDLSTGISPYCYPLPDVPIARWQRLPESLDGLEAAANRYYGSSFLLPMSGSQEAIQRLPLLRPSSRVGIISPAYHSHSHAWEKAHHQVIAINHSSIQNYINDLDVLIIVNPTNPSANTFSKVQLQAWHQQLHKKGGWLIIDEAFIDSTPQESIIEQTPKEGLIVLRSIGKFFGLAGIRLGFVWAEASLLHALIDKQDDWSVSNVSRWAGQLALSDTQWQNQQRQRLQQDHKRLNTILSQYYQQSIASTTLFSYCVLTNAQDEYQRLAQQGILTRLFTSPNALRFGLPANASEWQRLEAALPVPQ